MSDSSVSVEFWGSHPDEGNDDCWTGVDFNTLAEAEEFLLNPVFPTYCGDPSGTAFFQLIQTSGENRIQERVIPNPLFNAAKRDAKRRADDMMDRSEFSTQAGMAFGCDGYNDAEGY